MIPIIFNKDDDNNPKKGNVRSEDLALILGQFATTDAGVVNIGTNPLGIINTTYSTGHATFTFNKGYIYVLGRLIYVEQGEQVQIDLPASGTQNVVFGIKIDLGESADNEVTWFTKTSTYSLASIENTPLQKDNLMSNPVEGVYEFALYGLEESTTAITNTKAMFNLMQSNKDFMNGANFTTQSITDNSKKIATTEFVQNIEAYKVPLTGISVDGDNLPSDAQFDISGYMLSNGLKIITGQVTYADDMAVGQKRIIYVRHAGIFTERPATSANLIHPSVQQYTYSGGDATYFGTSYYSDTTTFVIKNYGNQVNRGIRFSIIGV